MVSSILASTSKKRKSLSLEQTNGGVRLMLISVGLLVLAVLPHLGHLRNEIIAIFLVLAGWRVAAQLWQWLPLNRWLIYLFAIIGFSTSAWFYGAPLGRDPGVSFLIVLSGLKCLEVQSKREIRSIVLLGLFIIATHFLYADGVSWALPLLFMVVCFIWLLAQTEHVNPKQYVYSDLKLVTRMLLQAVPFLIILFYLFPRLSGSISLFEANDNSALSGLSDKLRMGTISNLIQSGDIAFTATFAGVVPPPSERYWRGSVLWVTDGREWSRGGFAHYLKDKRQVDTNAEPLYRYEVNIEPSNQNWLFSLDYPISPPASAQIDADHHIFVNRRLDQPFRYNLESTFSRPEQRLSDMAHYQSLALNIPPIPKRFDQLIQSFTQNAASSTEVVDRVLNYFNQNDFIYTLQPPLLTSNSPVDEFLFESRRGFCGHYASSFATIMRAANIPARMVVGYLGGEFNPHSNQIVVRQSDAHAWTEVWIPNRGWVRVDPTAAIAPERVESGIDFDSSVNSDGVVLFSSRDLAGMKRFLLEVSWLKDAVVAKWHRWFLTFDQSRQAELLKSMGLNKFDIRVVSIFAVLLALGILTLVSFLLFHRDRIKLDQVHQSYLKFCNKLASMGVARGDHEGPIDFSKRAAQQLPQFSQQIHNITAAFTDLYYANQVTAPAEQAKQFNNMVKKFG